MEPDLNGLRAFLVVAEELHFGRAASRLFLTQQALSKRIRRLEEALAVQLFIRTTRKAELTPAGRRFLPLAREALATLENAIDAAREDAEPLRIDFHDERFTPIKVTRAVIADHPELRIEPSMRQGLAMAIPAVAGRELDAAFGRVNDLGFPWPAELRHRLVHLEPVHAYVWEGHPLAERREMRPADLRDWGIVIPGPGRAAESRGFFERFARDFGVPLRFTEPALGLDHIKELLRRERRAVMLGEASVAHSPGLHRITLTGPTPIHPWSIVWHRENQSQRLRRLLELLPAPEMPDDDGLWLADVDLRVENKQ